MKNPILTYDGDIIFIITNELDDAGIEKLKDFLGNEKFLNGMYDQIHLDIIEYLNIESRDKIIITRKYYIL